MPSCILCKKIIRNPRLSKLCRECSNVGHQDSSSKISKKRCCICCKRIPLSGINCNLCDRIVHTKCCSSSSSDSWSCHICLSQALPFSKINNNDFYFTINGRPSTDNLPSFSIQTLLDEMPGHKDNHEGDFLSNTRFLFYKNGEFFCRASGYS